jgi:hypothetical protein
MVFLNYGYYHFYTFEIFRSSDIFRSFASEKVNDLNYFNFETSNIIEILFLSVKHHMCAKNNTWVMTL